MLDADDLPIECRIREAFMKSTAKTNTKSVVGIQFAAAFWRSCVSIRIFGLLVVGSILISAGTATIAAPLRLCYNYDAWNLFYYGADDSKIQMALAPLVSNGVSTVMLSPNVGQAFICVPGIHLDMCHSNGVSPSDADLIDFANQTGLASNLVWAAAGVVRRWNAERVDPFGIAVSQARAMGLGVFLSFRLNDNHTLNVLPNGPYSDRFWTNHPQYRTGRNTLDFSNSEVRQYRVDQIHELIDRYPLDGVELDFLRSDPYFNFDNNAAYSNLMDDFVFQVATVVAAESIAQGRTIQLLVRVPSTLAGCLKLGLDPLGWAQNGYIDGIVLARYMRLTSDMDVEDFKREANGVPVYGCLEFLISTETGERMSSDEAYRGIGSALFARGADGLYLYNMYSSRNEGVLAHTESFGILSQLLSPTALAYTDRLFIANRLDVSCNGRDQGYEARSSVSLPTGEDDRPLSGVPMCGSSPNPPPWCEREAAAMRFPLETELYIGSVNSNASYTLRIIGTGMSTSAIVVQPNCRPLGPGTPPAPRTPFPAP